MHCRRHTNPQPKRPTSFGDVKTYGPKVLATNIRTKVRKTFRLDYLVNLIHPNYEETIG